MSLLLVVDNISEDDKANFSLANLQFVCCRTSRRSGQGNPPGARLLASPLLLYTAFRDSVVKENKVY